MNIKVRKLYPDAVLPKKAHPSDAGADLTVNDIQLDEENQVITYCSGIAVEIPEGYVGLLFPRSSVYKTPQIMTNCVGVIDSGYRGEVKAKFRMSYNESIDKMYFPGERFAQLIIMPYPQVTYEETEELSATDRGEGGYGSSGN